MGSSTPDKDVLPPFLSPVVHFDDNTSYELLKPITDLKGCHDGLPRESRIVFTCRRLPPQTQAPSDHHPTTTTNNTHDSQELIMKIKVQRPDPSHAIQIPHPGPSNTTTDELKVLERFSTSGNPHVPHLVSWKREVQGERGLLPGGYLVFIVMTKMPGENLSNLLYWDFTYGERERIVGLFLEGLRYVERLCWA